MWDHFDLMKGPCTPTCCTLLYASFFCFLLAGSELEPPVIGSTSFVAEGASAWLLNESIRSKVEVSSPEVGANVGNSFSYAMNLWHVYHMWFSLGLRHQNLGAKP
jgi:hypothetical protein